MIDGIFAPTDPTVALSLCGILAILLLACAFPQFAWLVQSLLDRPSVRSVTPPVLLALANGLMQASLLYASPLQPDSHPPALVTCALLVLSSVALAVTTAVMCWHMLRRTRLTTSRFSILESLNDLPAGAVFYDADGRCYLTNRTMAALCEQITGAPLMNGNLLWEQLESGPLNARRVSSGPRPVYQLADGSFWQFTRSAIQVDGVPLWQLFAADVTAQQQINDQLEEKNQELRDLAKRLARHNSQVTDLTRRKEILHTKTQIHDQIGHALISTRAYLAATAPGAAGSAAGAAG
ncbi:MAG: hypothetical protein Q4D06_08085, partial [Coriobacteriia bacterium]|nr:hypothetical protein [Coriobacteriia bacterium]